MWVGSPAGATLQRGHEPEIVHPRAIVALLTDEAWFTPIFSPDDPRWPVYVDIITPPVWMGGSRVEMIDLDLDVVATHDGAVEVLDRDEFDDHRVRYGYPDELVAGAETATAFVVEALEARRAPFDGAHLRWFGALDDDAGAPA